MSSPLFGIPDFFEELSLPPGAVISLSCEEQQNFQPRLSENVHYSFEFFNLVFPLHDGENYQLRDVIVVLPGDTGEKHIAVSLPPLSIIVPRAPADAVPK